MKKSKIVKSLVISAIIAILFTLAMAIISAHLHGTWATTMDADRKPQFTAPTNTESSQNTIEHKPPVVNIVYDEPSNTVQQSSPVENKPTEVKVDTPLIIDKPNYSTTSSGGITRISSDMVIYSGNVGLKLSLVNLDSSAYSALNQMCPKGTSVIYQKDGGLGSFKDKSGNDVSYAKVWCLYGADPQEHTSVNESLISFGDAVLDSSSCRSSEFSGQSWAQRLGC